MVVPSPTAPLAATHDPVAILSERFISAIRAAFPELDEPMDPLIQPSKQAALADFQCNAAMGLAKKLGMKPRDAAAAIVAKLEASDLCEKITESSIAGPGFINIRLRGDALSSLLERMDGPGLGVEKAPVPQTVVVDLFGVNLAKQMHVGHLRSPFLGDALARTLERIGHTVIRQNHLGDWGVPIAMVTAKVMAEVAAGRLRLDSLTLDQLDKAYRSIEVESRRDVEGLAAVRRFGLGPKAEAELEEQVNGATEIFTRGRQTLLALQNKDPAVFNVWKRIADVTMAVCDADCRRLHINVTPEHSAGESSYAEELAPMVEDLVKRGVAEPSEGALVVRLDTPEDGDIAEPCIIRKTDGGYLYATTDIAGIRRRVQKLGADRLIYAIDVRQNLHLRQVFGAARKAGYATNPRSGATAVMEHAAFGAVLGEDGRPFKTRSGESVSLRSLIDEAVERAMTAVRSRSPDLPEAEARATAEVIGVAAMKYADLCTDRVKDYVFSFDRMLAFEGNTGPYLLYALVRIKSIFRKAAERNLGEGWQREPLRIGAPNEKTLALALLRYPVALAGVAEALQPHRLCQYLFDLAAAFSGFFDACPVLQAENDAERRSRLRLCDLTRRVLEDGLHILGIPTLERM